MPSLSTGTMSVGILAVVAGLAGAWGVRSMLVKNEAVVDEAEVVSVPLAAADLPENRVIALGDIGLVPMTREQMEERGMPLQLVMLSPEQMIGRTLKTSIRQGEPFLTTSVFLQGTGPDITSRLKPGFRAMNIVAGRSAILPSPGDRVDVVFRSTPREAEPGVLPIPEVTKTILQAVEVLAVTLPPEDSGGGINRNGALDLRFTNQNVAPPPITVTLAVTAEYANIIRTVDGRGTLSMIIRSPSESLALVSSPQDAEAYTLEDLLGIEPPPPPPQPIFYRTDIYRAGARSSTVYVGGVVQEETGDDAEPATVPVSDDASPLLPPTEDDDAGDIQ